MAMIINMFVAATAGTLIPLGLRALKVDPALASSVFITTLTDVFGFFSFLGLATRVPAIPASARARFLGWLSRHRLTIRLARYAPAAKGRILLLGCDASLLGDALVLRTYRYGEADRIVVFLTEDRGKKRGVARNATKSRRRFGAALEPLTRGRAAYVEHESRELVRLDRIEPQGSPFRSTAGRDGDAAAHVLGYAAYFAELLDEWAPENAANERLFRLGAAVAEELCDGGAAEALGAVFRVLAAAARGRVSRAGRVPALRTARSTRARRCRWPIGLTSARAAPTEARRCRRARWCF